MELEPIHNLSSSNNDSSDCQDESILDVTIIDTDNSQINDSSSDDLNFNTDESFEIFSPNMQSIILNNTQSAPTKLNNITQINTPDITNISNIKKKNDNVNDYTESSKSNDESIKSTSKTRVISIADLPNNACNSVPTNLNNYDLIPQAEKIIKENRNKRKQKTKNKNKNKPECEIYIGDVNNSDKKIKNYDNGSHCNNIDYERNKKIWSNKLFNLELKRIGEKASTYRWMHIQEYSHYESMDYYTFSIYMFIFALLTLLTAAQFENILYAINLVTETITITIINTMQLITVFFLAMIIGIRESNKYPENIENHRRSSGYYESINSNIKHQYALPICERSAGKEFLASMQDEMSDRMDTAPRIRKKTYKKYIDDVLPSNPSFLPIEFGQIDTIDVGGLESPKKSSDEKLATSTDQITYIQTPGRSSDNSVPPLEKMTTHKYNIITDTSTNQAILIPTNDAQQFDNYDRQMMQYLRNF